MNGGIMGVGVALVLLASPALAELTPEEQKLREAIEGQVPKLARLAYERDDLYFAAGELELGLEVVVDSELLSQELGKVQAEIEQALETSTLTSVFSSNHMRFLGGKQREVHQSISLALAQAAKSVEASDTKGYTRYLDLLRRCYPSEGACEFLGMDFFEPLRCWVQRADVETLLAGGDYVEGKLLPPEEVEKLNRQHRSWEDPWVFSDEVHELRTNVPLRQAKQIMAFIGAYRSYFLARFADAWDLRTPKGKLPVIVTRTQAGLRSQLGIVLKERGMARGGGGRAQALGAAFYLHTAGTLDPCLVTYEPKAANGQTFTIPWDQPEQLEIALAHELTHQIAFEYSKYASQRTRQIRYQYWAVEALATFMSQHAYDWGTWNLRLSRQIPWGDRAAEGSFAYSKRNLKSLPTLRTFVGLTRAQCLTAENYQIGATLAYFLLEGEGGKYRTRFVTLLQTVHRLYDSRDSFEKAFKGVDSDVMQAEWQRFVEAIELGYPDRHE